MTIALDYDDTFTAAPLFWKAAIALGKAFGVKFICVTCRSDTVENRQEIDAAFEPVALPLYCTSGAPKQWYMQGRGVKVDMWCDDHVESILHGR